MQSSPRPEKFRGSARRVPISNREKDQREHGTNERFEAKTTVTEQLRLMWKMVSTAYCCLSSSVSLSSWILMPRTNPMLQVARSTRAMRQHILFREIKPLTAFPR